MKTIYRYLLLSLVLALGIGAVPTLTQATDLNISTVTINSISAITPSTTADYSVTFDVAFGILFLNVRFYPVATDDTLGDSALSGFDFSSTTYSSDTLPSGTTLVLNDNSEFSIAFDSLITTGTYTITLHDVQNTATAGNYKMGLTTTINATDADFVKSDAFAITTDSCVDITTTELADVTATSFGTNVSVTRGDSTTTPTSYTLAYARTQAAIDDNTASTVDMTAVTSAIVEQLSSETAYIFQVSALDANNCVLARTSVSATTKRAISKQRYVKPTVNKITKRTAVAHWVANDFVDSYDLQLWSKTKLLKRFNNLTALKKTLTKRYLKSGKTYKVRVRADYTTEETTRWSKFKQFTTK